MLFNSFVFAFLFLPIVLFGCAVFSRAGRRNVTVAWLTLASLFYYGWWNPRYLVLIVGSIAANYLLGRMLRAREPGSRRPWLWLGVGGNLALLGYFKYAGFFAENLSRLAGADLSVGAIALPLAISFFTFQQIAYLVDSHRGLAEDHGPLDYALFVTFFPQLIAGPIVHHREMMPQFARRSFELRADDLAAGLTFFAIGLFKKAVLADGIAEYSSPVFAAAELGRALGPLDAWGGALGYTLQLYFDFSGYSDMAIGLARMFGIHLPWNFHSPYKAASAIDFWRRWHITLSHFLRDYVYISFGGNRRGPARRYANLFATMLLGGLWHGAGWTFVLWGALHGAFLVTNHAFRALRASIAPDWSGNLATRALARAMTFVAVVFGWVLFRAESYPATLHLWQAMLGAGSAGPDLVHVDVTVHAAIGAMLAVAWWFPNTQEWMRRAPTGLDIYGQLGTQATRWLEWRATPTFAVAIAVLAMAGLYRMMEAGYEEFLYRFF
jgi:D-alanyl-lipoteichoic acid acyltransferase DltB (MBOAT superfamily)